MGCDEFILTMVFSHWTLSKIVTFLTDYLDLSPGELGPCKIERYRNKRTGLFCDSNRTLVLMKYDTYMKALEAGLDKSEGPHDLRIDRYRYKESQHPEEGYSSDLYLVVPKQIHFSEIEKALDVKLLEMVKSGLLKRSEYRLEIPVTSRIVGETQGYAKIVFAKPVLETKRLTIKLLLHDCFIYFEKQDKLYHLPVFWAKKHYYEKI